MIADWQHLRSTPEHIRASRKLALLRNYREDATSLDKDQKRPAMLTEMATRRLLNAGFRPEDEIEQGWLWPIFRNPVGLVGVKSSKRKARPSVIERIECVSEQVWGEQLPPPTVAGVINGIDLVLSSYEDDADRLKALYEAYDVQVKLLRSPPQKDDPLPRLAMIAHYDGWVAHTSLRLADKRARDTREIRRLFEQAWKSQKLYRIEIGKLPQMNTPLGAMINLQLLSNELQSLAVIRSKTDELRSYVVEERYFERMAALSDLIPWSEPEPRQALSIASLLHDPVSDDRSETMLVFGRRLLRAYHEVISILYDKKGRLDRQHPIFDLNIPLFVESFPPAQTPAMSNYMALIHREVLDEFRIVQTQLIAAE